MSVTDEHVMCVCDKFCCIFVQASQLAVVPLLAVCDIVIVLYTNILLMCYDCAQAY